MSNPNPIIPVHSQFQPGNPGGPGRPRKRPLSEAYDEWLRMEIPEPWRKAMNSVTVDGRKTNVEILKKGATFADAITYGLGKKAMSGDAAAAKELGDRTEGKPTQRIELAESEGRRPEFLVRYATAIPGVKTIDLDKIKSSEDIDAMLKGELEELATGDKGPTE